MELLGVTYKGDRPIGPSCGETRRRIGCRSMVALLVLTVASLLGSAPALGASQRGHVFAFSFGTPGTGGGQFAHPGGIAVNNTTGEIYVADTNNDRVEELRSVLNGQGETVGAEYVRSFNVPAARAVAVDNSASASDPSSGDVYVIGGKTKPAIYKFNAEGTEIFKLSEFKNGEKGVHDKLEAPQGIAVDSSGTLFVHLASGVIYTFDDAIENTGVSRLPSALAGESGQPGLAVDSEGDLYAGVVGAAAALASGNAGLENVVGELKHEFTLENPGRSLALVAKLEASTGDLLTPTLDDEAATGVAVDSAGDEVYVLNLGPSLGGEQAGAVAAFGADGSPIERFSAPGLIDGEGIAVDAQSGDVFVADAATDRVDVFALEPRGLPTVQGLSACSQGSSSASGCPDALHATTLRASVGPTGADTHYHFEYGRESCAAVPASCTQTTTTDAGEGFSEQSASVELQNLPPGAYHYRLVAENTFGTVESAEQTFTVLASTSGLLDGRAWEMVSPPEKDGAEPEPLTKEGGAIQAAEDGEAITYVADGPMPAGVEPEGSRSPEYAQIFSVRGAQGWSSRDITPPNTKGLGIETGLPPEYQLFSNSLALGLLDPGEANNERLAQPPLSPPITPGEVQERTIYLRDDAPLQPDASEVASYEKAAENGKDMTPPNPGYLALVTQLNTPGGAAFGGPSNGGATHSEGLEFVGATPDLGHSVVALRNTSKGTAGLYEWGPGDEKALQPVSVLPGGTLVGVSPELAQWAALGGSSGKDTRNAISDNGALVYWGGVRQGKRNLYVRDTQTSETLQIDVLQPGASGQGGEEAQFQTASADGTRVFFTDTQRLTPNSKALSGAPDLYAFDLTAGAGPLSGTLTDLTPQAGANVEADPEGAGVLGASEDGSYVYFVANGALAPGASRGYCQHGASVEDTRPPGTTCNLYVRHFNGTEWTPTKLIAALSPQDVPDWGVSGKVGDLTFMTSRVSPNGRYLAFMSDRSLTGYDNEDVTSRQPGERLDEEVYEYDAESEGLVCASCNPSGERPAGVLDTGEASGEEGTGLVVDRPKIWARDNKTVADSWLAGSVPGWTAGNLGEAFYQSRYLSDTGRLFFNSPDHLVPAATGEKEKVYEYERDAQGDCHSEGGCVGLVSLGASSHESAFLDASANGNDAFFLTAAPLVASDVNSNFDIYDARVCGETCPPPPGGSKAPCEETCQGSYTPAPGSPALASATSSGSGNLVQQLQVLSSKASAPPKPLTRAQLLAKAVKTCRTKYKKKKSKRVACEKQARRRYGSHAKGAAAANGASEGRH